MRTIARLALAFYRYSDMLLMPVSPSASQRIGERLAYGCLLGAFLCACILAAIAYSAPPQ